MPSCFIMLSFFIMSGCAFMSLAQPASFIIASRDIALQDFILRVSAADIFMASDDIWSWVPILLGEDIAFWATAGAAKVTVRAVRGGGGEHERGGGVLFGD